MKKLYEFYWDCGRMGNLQGLFVAEESEIKNIIGKEIYFGEVLGKHSDIYGILEKNNLVVKSVDQNFITKLVEIIGNNTISGYNPLNYYEESENGKA